MEIEIDPKIRFLVLYRDAQFSIDRIHKIIGTSTRTLRDWRKRLEKGENILTIQEGRGRKKKFTEFFRKIKSKTVTKPQRASTRSSGVKFGISKTSTGRIFHELGFSYKKIVVKHKLTKEEKKDRIKFCEELLQNNDEISESFWADETGIWLSDCSKEKMWTLEGEVNNADLSDDVKLNIWAAISLKGATSLYIYKENFNERVYQQILEERKSQMEKLLPRGYYYFHDRHPVHKSKLINNWANKNNLILTLLPSKASDLNPIENLWAWLKGSIAKDSPTSETALIRSLKENWKKVDKDFIFPYIDSLHNRCKICIERKGDYTGY
jgi:transposase